MMHAVKAKCKSCGKEAPADQFKLNYHLRYMVCPDCFRSKLEKKMEPKSEPVRPPGWDKEDEYLEKANRMRKQEQQSVFSRISGSDQLKCTCTQCRFTFRYNPIKNNPATCPYCATPVPKLRSSLL